MKVTNQLSTEKSKNLLQILEARFKKNMHRHLEISWEDVRHKLEPANPKLWSLDQMEQTGGEPDVIGKITGTGEFIFVDCAAETPSGRRSLCYDREAFDARKEHKPLGNAQDMAADMGVELLTEEEYRQLQQFGPFDAKTSSWIRTPTNIRKLGGALFADFRYGKVFIYHNGAQSYYATRAFRGIIRI